MNFIKASMDYENALLDGNRERSQSILHMAAISGHKTDFIQRLVTVALESIEGKLREGSVTSEQAFRCARIGGENIKQFIPSGHHAGKNTKVAFAALDGDTTPEAAIVSALLKIRGYSVFDYGQGNNSAETADMALRDNVRVLAIMAGPDAGETGVQDVRQRLKLRGGNIKTIALCRDGLLCGSAGSSVKNASQMANYISGLLENAVL